MRKIKKDIKAHSQEFVESVFEKYDCVLLNTYYNSKTKLYFKCSCGETDKTNFSSFRKRKNKCCSKCAKRNKDLELFKVAKDEIEKLEFSVLNVYKNTNNEIKIDLKCVCGEMFYKVDYYGLRSKKTLYCKKCVSIERAKEVEKSGSRLIGEYVNDNATTIILCPKGHERRCSIFHFRRSSCPECAKIKKRKDKVKEYNKIISDIEKEGYTVIKTDRNYSFSKTIEAICSNGHHRSTEPKNFLKFSCLKCLSPSYEDEIKSMGYTLLEPIKTPKKIIAQCPNGHKRESSISLYRKSSCGDCLVEANINRIKKEMIEDGYKIIELPKTTEGKAKAICPNGHLNHKKIHSFLAGECRKCAFSKVSGKNHCNWKGGVSTEQQLARGSMKLITWRRKVFSRDRYTCQCCLRSGVEINAHHIKNFSEYIDLRYDTTNGITLCEHCHSKKFEGSFHRVYGDKNNNKEQLQEYVHNYNFECFMST